MRINGKKISKSSPVFIIAEAGVNHNGSIKLAKKLVEIAIKSGANAVKFQTYTINDLIRRNAPKAAYQDKNIGKKITQQKMLTELQLSHAETVSLKKYCDNRNITFLSTVYDLESLKLLESLRVNTHKLASMDVVFHPLIEAIAKTKKPLILSTGMASLAEVEESIRVFKNAKGAISNLSLLQCNTDYPSNINEQNLNVLKTYKKLVPIIGFSDHTIGNEASIVAIALGAKIIERHFTLNQNMTGPDHRASLNPQQLASFIRTVRTSESALGVTKKIPTKSEKRNIIAMRRSICAASNIPASKKITLEDLAFKRPGNGLLPLKKNIYKMIGKITRHQIKKDKNINFQDLK